MSITSPDDYSVDPVDNGKFRIDPEVIPTNMYRIIQNVSPRWVGSIFTFEMACEAMGVNQSDPDLHDYAVAFHDLLLTEAISVHSTKDGKTYYKLNEHRG